LIVQESEIDPLIVFIHPKEVTLDANNPTNVAVMLREGGNNQHYITFEGGLLKDADFLNMLIKFEKSDMGVKEDTENPLVINASLKTLLSFHEKLGSQNQFVTNPMKVFSNHESSNKLQDDKKQSQSQSQSNKNYNLAKQYYLGQIFEQHHPKVFKYGGTRKRNRNSIRKKSRKNRNRKKSRKLITLNNKV